MSLLKAYKLIRHNKIELEELKSSFMEVIDGYDGQTHDYVTLLGIYANLAVEYLVNSATTLEKNQEMQDAMQMMNSYIAEVGVDLQLHYYDKERGKSIVDMVVQNALDNGEPDYNFIMGAIDMIEDSYYEEEICEDETDSIEDEVSNDLKECEDSQVV